MVSNLELSKLLPVPAEVRIVDQKQRIFCAQYDKILKFYQFDDLKFEPVELFTMIPENMTFYPKYGYIEYRDCMFPRIDCIRNKQLCRKFDLSGIYCEIVYINKDCVITSHSSNSYKMYNLNTNKQKFCYDYIVGLSDDNVIVVDGDVAYFFYLMEDLVYNKSKIIYQLDRDHRIFPNGTFEKDGKIYQVMRDGSVKLFKSVDTSVLYFSKEYTSRLIELLTTMPLIFDLTKIILSYL